MYMYGGWSYKNENMYVVMSQLQIDCYTIICIKSVFQMLFSWVSCFGSIQAILIEVEAREISKPIMFYFLLTYTF